MWTVCLKPPNCAGESSRLFFSGYSHLYRKQVTFEQGCKSLVMTCLTRYQIFSGGYITMKWNGKLSSRNATEPQFRHNPPKNLLWVLQTPLWHLLGGGFTENSTCPLSRSLEKMPPRITSQTQTQKVGKHKAGSLEERDCHPWPLCLLLFHVIPHVRPVVCLEEWPDALLSLCQVCKSFG